MNNTLIDKRDNITYRKLKGEAISFKEKSFVWFINEMIKQNIHHESLPEEVMIAMREINRLRIKNNE